MKTNTNALISAWYSLDFLNVTLAPFIYLFFASRVCKKDVQHRKMCTASRTSKENYSWYESCPPHTHESTQKVPSET